MAKATTTTTDALLTPEIPKAGKFKEARYVVVAADLVDKGEGDGAYRVLTVRIDSRATRYLKQGPAKRAIKEQGEGTWAVIKVVKIVKQGAPVTRVVSRGKKLKL